MLAEAFPASVSGFSAPRRRHSKKGCLTCKVRKKRCSEDRPVCRDCARLNLPCVYPDNLSKEEVKGCKLWLQEELKKRKNKAKSLLDSENEAKAYEAAACASASNDLGPKSRTEDALCASLEDTVQHHLFTFVSPETPPKLTSEFSPSMLDMVLTNILETDRHDVQELPDLDMKTEQNDENVDDALLGQVEADDDAALVKFQQHSQFSDPHMSQPLSEPLIMELDQTGAHLYNYYRDHLAQVICIAPARQNFYLQCFLPMAHKHRGVLYGILAWSAHHLSISRTVATLDEGASSRLIMDRDSHFSKLANNYTLESLRCLYDPHDHQEAGAASSFLYSLAQILVLCGAEICQGDVNRWQILLKTGAKLIKEHIGSSNLISLLTDSNSSKFDAIDLMTRNWLLANFIYHDIMGSQTTKFPMEQYETLLLSSNTNFTDWNLQVDSLHGLNRPIFKVLGETTNLIRQMKDEKISVTSPNFKNMIFHALELNQQLLNVVPDENGLEILSHCTDDNDNAINYKELSEHLFEIFRLSALIHLKTNVLKVENNSFEVSFYTKTLLSKLDLVLGTKLESSLCFPMFICGINCIDKDRRSIETKFLRYIETYKCRNVVRAHDIMHNVWKMDDEGESIGSSGVRERDWIDICDDIGWDISFA